MIKKVLDQLKTQHKFSDKIFKTYEFEIRGNRIFIMTKQAKQFEKIKSVRKGILFARELGNKIIISEDVSRLLNNKS